MLNICIGLLTGAYVASALPMSLPVPLCLVLAIAAIGLTRYERSRLSTGFLAGLAIMGLASGAQLRDRLEIEQDGRQFSISVKIADFVQVDGDSLRFAARPVGRSDLPSKIRLTWFQPEKHPQIGDTWRLNVRLRRPHGYANPGGFDYEGWLFRQRIGATGYVVSGTHNYRIDGAGYVALDRVRRAIAGRLSALLPADHATAVLLAITVGARHRITSEQWDLYARTGTSHLMAISGLHIGLAAGSAYVLCWCLAATWPGSRNLRDAALAGALVAALGYATMSGFAVPARRAIAMAAIAAGMGLIRRRIRPGVLLATSCMVIFVTDPLSILAPGFKLSFVAVGILFIVAQPLVVSPTGPQYPRCGAALTALVRLISMQFALLAGLFPLTVTEFGRFTMLAPFVNLAVLPVFNLVTVPLSLAGTLLDGLPAGTGDGLLVIAHNSVQRVLGMLDWAAQAEFLSIRTAAGGAVVTIILSLLFVCLPSGWPGRRLAILAIFSVVTFRPVPPPQACFDFHALDVGQGLAVVVQTRSHSLLFDTGPSFQDGADAAGFTVLPFLVRRGITRLDRVVVSHADLDHSGGILSVIAGLEVGDVVVGEPVARLGRAQSGCFAGDAWQWDGVHFNVLHPRAGSPWSGNNSSCVLEVSVGKFRLLLTGDIESPVEKLLAHYKVFRPSYAVLVPHHGSRTSSDWSLVASTGPTLAIVSAGFRNRWGFPKEDVMQRWSGVGARVLNTATSGAVSQRLCATDGAGELHTARQLRTRSWHDRTD